MALLYFFYAATVGHWSREVFSSTRLPIDHVLQFQELSSMESSHLVDLTYQLRGISWL